jgi:hypothetical protein
MKKFLIYAPGSMDVVSIGPVDLDPDLGKPK